MFHQSPQTWREHYLQIGTQMQSIYTAPTFDWKQEQELPQSNQVAGSLQEHTNFKMVEMGNYGHSKPKQLETHWQPDNRASWPVSMYNQ